ncbi:Plasmid stabilization system protein ParE [Halpernia humi]|uniref:Plasmid stabilization system protein ParE n=1 Tax=Halpernia humi TaxID=493375 RepID=A0A1H5T206_9FLAO|nr:type II toxin-antitoxin system RelE/ParE family toxin [Halpernia humi]SEF56922.1 Plasmid stabilization system protein ParE [Halpernia humi]
MIYKLKLRKRAVNQMQKSYDFYESKSIALGEKFISTVEKYFERISNNPKHFQIKREEIREAYIKVFPFVIVYQIIKDTIIIYSIFHTSRNPSKKK